MHLRGGSDVCEPRSRRTLWGTGSVIHEPRRSRCDLAVSARKYFKGTKVACGVSLCLCSRELARGARVWVAL